MALGTQRNYAGSSGQEKVPKTLGMAIDLGDSKTPKTGILKEIHVIIKGSFFGSLGYSLKINGYGVVAVFEQGTHE